MTTTQLRASLEGLDEFIDEQLQLWKGVGTAVAVIHKDEVIWQKGYGYRDLESKLEVTPNTLFAIGSSTKAFTAATAALLVDQGILDWDAPVKTYMKDFRCSIRWQQNVSPFATCCVIVPVFQDMSWYGTTPHVQEKNLFVHYSIWSRIKISETNGSIRT